MRGLGDHPAGPVEESGRAVAAFLDVGRVGAADQQRPHLLGDPGEPARQYRQRHRVHPAIFARYRTPVTNRPAMPAARLAPAHATGRTATATATATSMARPLVLPIPVIFVKYLPKRRFSPVPAAPGTSKRSFCAVSPASTKISRVRTSRPGRALVRSGLVPVGAGPAGGGWEQSGQKQTAGNRNGALSSEPGLRAARLPARLERSRARPPVGVRTGRLITAPQPATGRAEQRQGGTDRTDDTAPTRGPTGRHRAGPRPGRGENIARNGESLGTGDFW